MAKDDVLRSVAADTGLRDLITACGDARMPAVPPRPPIGDPIALTMSGGGFRATLPALGGVRLLADAGLLERLRYVSSVSGGSVANAVLAKAWPALRAAGYSTEAVDRLVIDPVVERISSGSLKMKLVRNVWRTIGPKNRTGLLADAFDDWWLDGTELADLDPEVRWIINAGNTTTGVRFGFERDVVGDYVTGLAGTEKSGLRLATAAAASAAVPGAFAKVTLPTSLDFPCGERGRPRLLDGGIYDNTGLEAIDSASYADVFTITLNAGGAFTVGRGGGVPIVGDLLRSQAMLYRQSTAVRTRWMVQKFKEGTRKGVLYALATDVDRGGGAVDAFVARYPEHRTWDGKDLAFVPTVFDKLDEDLCRLLVHRGWWLAGAHLARWHATSYPLPDLGAGPPVPAAGRR